MSEKLSNNNEEVDLGQLFKLIGQGFSNLINGIKNIFKSILNLFIQIALFIKKHFIKLAIATVLGLTFGFYQDYSTTKTYESSMLVRPNYGSTSQLYTEIAVINNLVDQQKISLLKELGLDENDDLDIDIRPIKSEKIELEVFDKFVKKLDTTTIKDVSFERFIAQLKDVDYPVQEITINTNKQAIFTKIKTYLNTNLAKNPLLQARMQAGVNNITFKEQQLQKSLKDIDSLRVVYNKSILAEANKISSGTSIVTATQKTQSNKELELFTKKNKIVDELNELANTKANESKLLQVIADFSEYGNPKIKISKTSTFTFGLIGFLLAVFFILLLQFNKYLSKISK